jgi:hypothetical protein
MEVVMQSEIDALKKRLYRDNKVKNVKFFPGLNADTTPEDMAREMNVFFADRKETDSDSELSAD